MQKLDFLDQKFINNPFPTYKDLRKDEPVYQFLLPGGVHAWIVTTYEDAQAIFKDPRFVINPMNQAANESETDADPYKAIMSKNLLSVSSADHRRLRRLIQKAFTPKMVEGLRERIEDISEELLERMATKKEIDLIDDFAFPLPIIVICEMLGIPHDDQADFREWSNIIMEGINNPQMSAESDRAIIYFVDYLRDLITKRRVNLQNDLLSDLIKVEEDGEKLSEEEMYALVFVLILAGHETTVNLIGNGMLALFEYPQQKEKLLNDPSLIHPAVEEMLRYNGPAEVSNIRWVSEAVDFKGKTFAKGEMVFIALSSANRDKEKFSDPDTFDITRKVNDHIAFGKGVHFCLGAPLARLEGEIAIGKLLSKYPHIQLTKEQTNIEWRPGMIIRGAKNIPVRLT